MQDLQGPKIRVGTLEGGTPIRLVAGEEFVITVEPGVVGRAGRIGTTYAGLAEDVRAGDRILLDDGLLELRVLAADPPAIRTVVVHGGLLGEHKGINLPGVPISAPALTDKDRADLEFGLALGVDYVALSFVRAPDDVLHARSVMQRVWPSERRRPLRRPTVPIVVKLEKPEAFAHLDAIIRAADAVMVARGDLAVEMSTEAVPPLQKLIIQKANAAGKPVITATQMLQSMIDNPTPTRAEASDVANAVLDGSDAVMLSGETAVGRYPIEAVQAMARIVGAAEAIEPDPRRSPPLYRTRVHALVRAAATLAEEVDARALIVFTRSGQTAERIAQCRPAVPIYAVTPHEAVRRRLALYWGVEPVRLALDADTDSLVAHAAAALTEQGRVRSGDLVVLVGATRRLGSNQADFIKLHVV
jgi:pyruvate kinase